jgi:hypothetical protein
VYVRNKERACAECGVVSIKHEVPEDASQEEVMATHRSRSQQGTQARPAGARRRCQPRSSRFVRCIKSIDEKH